MGFRDASKRKAAAQAAVLRRRRSCPFGSPTAIRCWRRLQIPARILESNILQGSLNSYQAYFSFCFLERGGGLLIISMV